MYATIRRYVVRPDQMEVIARRVEAGFVPIVRDIAGFRGYYLLDAGRDVGFGISVHATREGAEESNLRAAGWVRENLTPLILEGPEIVARGELMVHEDAPVIRARPISEAPENGRIARTLYDAFNRRELDHGAAVIAEDAPWTDAATGETLMGPHGYLTSMQRWLTAFPDGQVEVLAVHPHERGATVQFIGRGTHTGPMVTAEASILPTGRRVEMRFCDVITIREGKVQEGWTYYDLASMLQQIGITPAAALPLPA